MAIIAARSFLQPNWKPSKTTGIVLCSIFLFLASFQAWREQYERAEKNSKTDVHPSVTVNVPPISLPPSQVVVNIPPYLLPKGRTWINVIRNWAPGQDPPFSAGKSLALNIWFKNNPGNIAANEFRTFFRAIEKNHQMTAQEEDAAYMGFLAETRKPTSHSITLVPEGILWITIPRLKPFTPEEAVEIANKKLWTYFFALARYRDEVGTHDTEVCFVYTGTGSETLNCISHNGPTS